MKKEIVLLMLLLVLSNFMVSFVSSEQVLEQHTSGVLTDEPGISP